MYSYEQYKREQPDLEVKAQDLAEDIEKAYGRFDVNVKVTVCVVQHPRICFRLKVKGKTRKAHLLTYAVDVQRRLKLPVFQIEERKFDVLLIVSEQEIKYPHLPDLLKDRDCIEAIHKMQLPYIIGYNTMGDPAAFDLAMAPHLLLGGATCSGKSVGLQALITSVAFIKSPSRVRFILIDIGANDLMPFAGLPHLACPVVREKTAALHVLAVLTDEIKRRRDLEHDNPTEFQKLPLIVLVIDELPALMQGNDKNTSDFLVNSINNVLERGRHTKVHAVLAAQNPTLRNIKVDLSNAAARIAFKCSKRNNADTIIEGCGAENLLGAGDMYFLCPGHDLQRLRGIYITRQEIGNTIRKIGVKWIREAFYPQRFIIPDVTVQEQQDVVEFPPSQCVSDALFAQVAYYTLGAKTVSANKLSQVFHIGWNRADCFMKELYRLHIVSAADGKLRRRVIPQCVEDVPENVLQLLSRYGFSAETVGAAINKRLPCEPTNSGDESSACL